MYTQYAKSPTAHCICICSRHLLNSSFPHGGTLKNLGYYPHRYTNKANRWHFSYQIHQIFMNLYSCLRVMWEIKL